MATERTERAKEKSPRRATERASSKASSPKHNPSPAKRQGLSISEALRHLGLIHPQGGGFVLSAITAKGLTSRYVASEGNTEKFIRELVRTQEQERGIGVYYGLAEYKTPPNGRGAEAEAFRVRCVWADVDKPSKGEARERVEDFAKRTGFRPSILIDTGAGYQPAWLLREPVEVGPFPEVDPSPNGKPKSFQPTPEALRVRAVLAALARELQGDRTIDLARVFRLAGTHNTKCYQRAQNPKYKHYTKPLPCSIVEAHPELRYSLEDLERIVTEADQAAANKQPTPRAEAPSKPAEPTTAIDLDDSELIEKAKAASNGNAFAALWSGDTSGYDEDDSRADLALLNHLAFWTGKDAPRMDRLFRQSGLMREKWERENYRTPTIEKAIQITSEVYSPTRKPSTVKVQATSDRRHLTDYGNAERLIDRHGGDLRYCWKWRKWLTWDGKRWAVNEGEAVEVRAKETVRSIYGEAATEQNEGERRVIAKHARDSEAAKRIKDLITMARSEPGIPIQSEDLDRDPWKLNVLNGTVDLRRAELHPHRREDLITKLVPVKYNPAAKAPTWERFLLEIMDGKQHLVEYLRRAFGYGITGSVREHVLYFLYGGGRNGKSTTLTAIRETLGEDYAREAPPELLMVKHGERHPTERMTLFGKRFISTVEVEDGKRIAEVQVKQLTGGDRISGRRMHENHWEFDPTHKIFLAANHNPEIRGTDRAIWSRIRKIPFTVCFEGREDRTLPDKLAAEREGILAWLIRGACEWYCKGSLEDPPEVLAAVEEYRKDMDTISDFIAERCVTGDTHYQTQARDLYGAFVDWHRDTIGDDPPLTATAFGRKMSDRFHKVREGGARWYIGIGLKNEGDAKT